MMELELFLTFSKGKVECEADWFHHYQRKLFCTHCLCGMNQAFRSSTTEMQILVERQMSNHTKAKQPLQSY